MPFVLKKRATPGETIVPVDLGPAGSLDLIVRPTSPSHELGGIFSALVEDANPSVLRALNSIVGWRGVNDEEGHEIPFSAAALADLMRSIPPFTVASIMTSVLSVYPQQQPAAAPATTQEQ